MEWILGKVSRLLLILHPPKWYIKPVRVHIKVNFKMAAKSVNISAPNDHISNNARLVRAKIWALPVWRLFLILSWLILICPHTGSIYQRWAIIRSRDMGTSGSGGHFEF